MDRYTYNIVAERSGGWWALSCPQLPGMYSQSRRLDSADSVAREAIALLLDVAPESFDIEVTTQVSKQLEDLISAARRASEEARIRSEEASKAMHDAARGASDGGLTVRDIGALLSVSPQRVSQLLTKDSFRLAAKGRMAKRGGKPRTHN